MLVQFNFKNFLSFKDETTFDMTAVNAYKEHAYNLIDFGQNEQYLKVAAIYGANASGKTNFIKAYETFRSIVLRSFDNIDATGQTILSTSYKPFLFSSDSNSDTEFESVYIYNNYEYRYGFVYNDQCIVYEWLYRKNLKSSRESIVFERDGLSIQLGASQKKSVAKYLEAIEKDTLVITFANRLNLDTTVFKEAFKGIFDTRIAISLDHDAYYLEQRIYILYKSEKSFSALLTYLNAIDVGIKDIKVEEQATRFNVYTFHDDEKGNRYKLPIFEESDGTLRALSLFFDIQSILDCNGTLFVDELNLKLHPLLTKFITTLFYENKGTAQLIYTTHDTTWLDKKYFRRDQLWFITKNAAGSSELVSLAEYKVRNDTSLEKAYLGGTFGGIPVLKNFDFDEVKYEPE